jgi:hypothetical protein
MKDTFGLTKKKLIQFQKIVSLFLNFIKYFLNLSFFFSNHRTTIGGCQKSPSRLFEK